MNYLDPRLVGLLVTGIFAVGVLGFRMARADVLDGLDVDDIVLLRDQSRRQRRQGLLDRWAGAIAPRLKRLLGPTLVGRIHNRVEAAGRPDGMTTDSFLRLVSKYLLVLGALALAMLLLGRTLSAVLALIAGPLLPFSRLARLQRLRQEAINADLPDYLDILAVTVSAGIGFRTALGRVAARFEGPLREELQQTLHQLDVGVSRRQAFTSLRERCHSDAMDSFVAAFLQAEELGAPLARTLGTIALDMRRAAAQAARQKAARTVPRVTLVVSVVLVPPTIGLIVVGVFLGSDVDLGSVLGGR